MSSITRIAPAKINLTLRVGPPRADGFHDLISVVAQLRFGDRVRVSRRADEQVTLECDAPGIPTDERNLAHRAATLLRDTAGITSGTHLTLEKHIPAGAGLGGGSSNAASALSALNELWELNLPHATLVALAAKLGSDVPLFLSEPVAVMRGRGEVLTPLNVQLSGCVVLITTDVHCDTAQVYRTFDALGAPGALEADAPLLLALSASETASSTDDLRTPRAFDPAAHFTPGMNDLAQAAFAAYPALSDLRDVIERATGQSPHLTGSGSALFLLARDEAEAAQRAAQLAEVPGIQVEITEWLANTPQDAAS